MAKVKMTTRLHEARVESFIEQVYVTCNREPELSPRPKDKICKCYYQNQFIIALEESIPVGWLLKIPLRKAIYEICAVYVQGGKRRQGIFKDLLTRSIDPSENTIFVTFIPWLAKYLQDEWRFRAASLWKIIIITRGKFLLPRLNISRLLAIHQHSKRGSPIYLIRNKNV